MVKVQTVLYIRIENKSIATIADVKRGIEVKKWVFRSQFTQSRL